MREAELMARDRWSRDDLAAFQRERVRALITHAVTHSPYYREALGADAADRPVVMSPLPNPAGRPCGCLLSVDGRTADILYLRAPDGATAPIHASVLGSAVAPIAEVGEYAFVYGPNGLHTQIVLTPGAPPDVPDRLRKAPITAICSTGAIPPAVDIQPVSAPEREPGRKIRLVRSV